jgi:phage terminase large subunit-like protein
MLESFSPSTINAIMREAMRKAKASFIGDNVSYRDITRVWRDKARVKQIPPEWDWFVWLILSGRGFGKTWTGANWTIERAALYPEYPIAIIGQTKADVRDTMVELGDSSILKQSPAGFMPEYEPSKRRLVWPNGAIGIIYSGDEPGQLRGPQHGSAWIDELSKFKYPQETWDMMEFGLRLGDKPQVAVTNTPRPIPLIKALRKAATTAVVEGSTYENEANLSPSFLARIKDKYEGTTLGRQELHGEIIEDVPGALWKRTDIENNRVTAIPDLVRIVVAIDPATTSNEDSDETGIVVAGISADKQGYVLDDKSLRASPHGWASEAVAAYNKYKADRIVAETNNGGDMVEETITTVNARVAFKQVHASRSKQTRAEPIAALYEQGKVHHVGSFAEMEDQMCSWLPGDKSPDRMDALVWALTDLMLNAPAVAKAGVNPFY